MTEFNLAPYRDQLLALHDHICPRQILGLRMGISAGQTLSIALRDRHKRLFCFVETDGCFADGVSVATSCTLGHRTLRLVDEGKIAATFIDLHGDLSHGLRIHPQPDVRQRALDLMPMAQSRWHAMFDAYQVLSNEALLCWQSVTLSVSLRDILSKPGWRVRCARCGEEIINGREHMIDDAPVCAACAGNSYWLASEGRL